MALVVQAYPPVAGANSYADVAYFKGYHQARLIDLSVYTDEQIEAALVKATQFLDIRHRFVGRRYAKEQTTEWPRALAYDDRGDSQDGAIPTPVMHATCEYALRALAVPLLADPARDESGQRVKSTSVTVGPIRQEVEYADGAALEMPAYPLADRILTSRGLVASPSVGGGVSFGSIGRA